jgi:hypothetical protein
MAKERKSKVDAARARGSFKADTIILFKPFFLLSCWLSLTSFSHFIA